MERPLVFNSVKFRIAFEIFFAFIFHVFLIYTIKPTIKPSFFGFIFGIFFFILMSEGVFLFNRFISKKYPWHLKTKTRILLLIGFVLLWSFLLRFLIHTLRPSLSSMSKHDFGVSTTLGFLFISIYVILLIVFNYQDSMGKLVVENERLKQDKLKLDYFALQDQINPHFLFNNLSTLIAIIQTDQKLAVRFAENFSDVYRYVLQSAEVYWVKLGDEVEFIKACFALHQERLGDGLRFNIDIPAEYFSFCIPPLSLQILVENAIKHNCATLKNPLKIDIFVRNNRLVVVNNLNPRNSSYSTNTGLQNLRKRYALLTEKVPVMTKTENEFIVEIPLIQSNNANESFSS